MEIDDLEQFDSNVDYTTIFPIHQKRTIAFINHFLTNTVSFLNDFAETCESRMLEFEYKLQKVEASLLILESQLSSIHDLNKDVVKRVQESTSVDNGLDLPDISETEVIEVIDETGPVASKDPRFIKYFKMVQFGVLPQVVKMKMEQEGLDPDIIDKPNEIIPGYIPPTGDD